MNSKIFENKNILIFLPHEDDEINMVYGLLDAIKSKNCKIKVVYSTNGDYAVSANERIKEAVASLRLVGIKKKDIIFMGYSDQAPKEKNHLYHAKEKWKSKSGKTETNTPNNDDYHYQKYKVHAKFNHNSFIEDIYNIINDFKYDILICVDYDSHPDHRALSLGFECALGKLLKQNEEYKPIVLKAFAYPTSYFGVNDFKNINLFSTKYLARKNSYLPYQNPYYDFDNRIRYEIGKKTRSKILISNPFFYACLKHRSQFILNKIYAIINNDQVFFERYTSNLCLNASISSSSGETRFLNDFMLFDCSNILSDIEGQFDKRIFTFDKEDKKRQITIELKDQKFIDKIVLYKAVDTPKIDSIIINGKKVFNFEEKYNQVHIDIQKKSEKITISFEHNVQLTEIEIMPKKIEEKYFKLCIGSDFVYKYYTKNDFEINYYTNISEDEIILKKNNKELVSRKIKINKGEDFELFAYDKSGMLLDKVNILYLSKKREFNYQFIMKCNDIALILGRICNKIIRVLRKVRSSLWK